LVTENKIVIKIEFNFRPVYHNMIYGKNYQI